MKGIYRTKQKTDQKMGKRSQRRKERSGKRRSLVMFGVKLTVAAVIFFVAVILATGIMSNNGDKSKTPPDKKPPVVKKQTEFTLAIRSVSEATGKMTANKMLVLRFDTTKGTANGLLVDGNTFVGIPGHGFDRVEFAMLASDDVFKKTAENLSRIKVDHIYNMREQDFETMHSTQNLAMIFSEAIYKTTTEKQNSELKLEALKIKKTDTTLMPMPVEPVSLGDQSFYQPKQEDLDYILKVLWGLDSDDSIKPVRILILNGAGLPGIGTHLAQKLINGNYEIVDIKNADSFDNKTTQILIYNGDTEAAEQLKKDLGIGVLVDRPIDQGVAELAIYVGLDYASFDPTYKPVSPPQLQSSSDTGQ